MVMTLRPLLSLVFLLELCAYSRAEALEKRDYSETCNQIAEAISSASQVFYPRERIIFTYL